MRYLKILPSCALLLLTLTCISGGSDDNEDLQCQDNFILPNEAEIYHQVTPYGNTSAGVFTKVNGVLKLEDCIVECCKALKCNVVFLFRTTCYLIECASYESCRPLHRTGRKFAEAYMVRLRSIGKEIGFLENGDSFDMISDLNDMRDLMRSKGLLDYPSHDNEGDAASLEETVMSKKGSAKPMSCYIGIRQCPLNEECVARNNRARHGLCSCVKDFVRDLSTGRCKLNNRINETTETTLSANSSATSKATFITPVSPSPTSNPDTVTEITHLIVSAGENKVLQLPENEVTLSAYALQDDLQKQFHYEWTLVSHPDGDETGTMGDKNSATLKLTSLREGLYIFKVSVYAEGQYGESFVNVTVMPRKRVNQPPVAIINPANQTVKLPNTNTVLDGSASTDDDKIMAYHWEQVSAPIDYQPELTDTATLQLKNLVQGFYRFMLTVTDSNGAINSTYANISVIKEPDYPPTANAGTDVIIYLPQTEVVLNGNLSTDDKGVKLWEWTKGADNNKAVDMQNTHTPYLHLSNLGIGMYTFKLKVTDTADQSSTAEVRVFVKPESNADPVAEPGENQEITLPSDSVVLDGSKSHDDIGIKTWEWKQLSGPNEAKLSTPDQEKTNASGLTKGLYVFQLTVIDDKRTSNSKTVSVRVKQMENQAPKAFAGGDKTIQLPTNVIILNGSASTDDLEIVSYKWTRDPSSLAAGIILENSDSTPTLKLTDLIPGRYLFKLKVSDNQGASSEDTASLIVKSDVHEKDNVELQINADIFWFTEEQKETLAKKLALLLHDEGEIQINIKSVASTRYAARVILVFDVESISESKKSVVLPGTYVVSTLKRKLQTDSSLLDFEILLLDTVICQNNCSGHGTCDQASKRCVCEAFWMEDLLRYHFRDKISNCDWSILYVIIIFFIAVVSVTGLAWTLFCLCRRMRFRRPRKRHKYTLLDDGGDRDNLTVLSKGKIQMSSLMMSDSDLESDTVFDKKQVNGKTNGHHSYQPMNGFVHPTRKVKT